MTLMQSHLFSSHLSENLDQPGVLSFVEEALVYCLFNKGSGDTSIHILQVRLNIVTFVE